MFHIVIPARYGSTRLPGKALADIAGKPMVWWVWQRALSTSAASVIVATDHEEIAAVMTDFGADVQMTKATHPSGTDRLAEVVERRGWADDTVVVNLQGDEPLMPESNIHQVATELSNHPGASIATWPSLSVVRSSLLTLPWLKLLLMRGVMHFISLGPPSPSPEKDLAIAAQAMASPTSRVPNVMRASTPIVLAFSDNLLPGSKRQ
jgi:GTP:adenosylcobinamide-phosphate guanylyltransferase